jgi:S1-C subfamily serine protease
MNFKMSRLKVLCGAAALILLGILTFSGNTVHPKSSSELSRTAVMITNMAGNSGGSGVILHSDKEGSTILTNHHVCNLAYSGARLTTSTTTALVTSFKISQFHDLCLITTKTNLGVSTELSSLPPSLEDESIVSGFPNLNPHSVTKGYFSNRVTIPVMKGVRECTPEEQSGDLQIVCMFLGGIPLIELYDSQYTTSLIMAGSSGSAVFNIKGEISGLVFAGGSGIAFGFIVPWEYLNNFVKNEVPNLPVLVPNMQLDISSIVSKKIKFTESKKNLLAECEKSGVPQLVLNICNSISKSVELF